MENCRRNDFALILCIDSNKKILDENDNVIYRYYEYEAIKCIESWRENGGFLKKSPIYLFNFNEKFNSSVIEKYFQYENIFLVDGYKFKSSYINKHLFLNTLYAQYIAGISNIVNQKYILYVDLDMYLKKPIPQEIIESNTVVIGEYTNVENSTPELKYRFDNMKKLKSPIHNTYFMLYDKSIDLFDRLNSIASSNEYEQFFEKYIKFNNDDYFFEEGIYDYNYIVNKDRFLFKYNTVDEKFINEFFEHRHLAQKDIFSIQSYGQNRSNI